VLAEILWLILCDQVVQSSEHIRLVSVEIALDCACQNTFGELHDVCEVDVERRKLKLRKAVNLCNVVSVRCYGTRCRCSRWCGVFGESTTVRTSSILSPRRDILL
jgi:hypothetical protein